MKKEALLKLFGATVIVTLSLPLLAYAGKWEETSGGKRWQKDDGSYPANTWEWIDDDGDGISKCYYFNENGYLLTDTTTPDNYTVNRQGEWTVDYIVERKGQHLGAASLPGAKVPPVYLTPKTASENSQYPEGANVYERQIGDPSLQKDGIIVDGDIYAYYTGMGEWKKSAAFYLNGTRTCIYYLPTREEFEENCRRAKLIFNEYLDWEKEQRYDGVSFGSITYYGDGKGAYLFDHVEDVYYLFDITNYKTDENWDPNNYKMKSSEFHYELQN